MLIICGKGNHVINLNNIIKISKNNHSFKLIFLYVGGEIVILFDDELDLEKAYERIFTHYEKNEKICII